jgi:hypothetical protein
MILLVMIYSFVCVGLFEEPPANDAVPTSLFGRHSLFDAAANGRCCNDRSGNPAVGHRAPLDVSRSERIEPPGYIIADVGCEVVLVKLEKVSGSGPCVR